MVGLGKLRRQAQVLIRESGSEQSIKIHNPCPPGELAVLISESRVLVHSSRFEGSPRIVLEALAVGTPVASFVQSDPDKWIEKFGGGEYAKDTRPSSLAEAMQECRRSSNREFARSVHERAAEHVVPNLEDYLIRPNENF